MFERLFPKRPRTQPPLPEPTPQLALGALLVRIAIADHTVRAIELAAIDKILSATFGLRPIAAAKLRATCESLERHAPGTDTFAAILRDAVPYEDRLNLARAMWQVLLADGQRLDVEEDALHSVERALGISEADSAAIQAQALG